MSFSKNTNGIKIRLKQLKYLLHKNCIKYTFNKCLL